MSVPPTLERDAVKLRAAVLIAIAGLLLLTATCSGCWTTHRRDPLTIQNVEESIRRRAVDHALWRDAYDAPTRSAQTIENLERLHIADLDWLQAWKWREEQKRDE